MKILRTISFIATSIVFPLSSSFVRGQVVTFQPYVQPGDSGPFSSSDQMVVAWQTNDTVPNPSAYSVSVAKDLNFDKSTQVPVANHRRAKRNPQHMRERD